MIKFNIKKKSIKHLLLDFDINVNNIEKFDSIKIKKIEKILNLYKIIEFFYPIHL